MNVVYNDLTYARNYLEEKIFCLDIETHTTVPEDSGWSKAFGLSNATSIDYISFYADGLNPLVLKLAPIEGDFNYQTLSDEEQMVELAKQSFIAEMIERDHTYRVIGHNVIFDLGRLGAHYKFQVNRNTKVWDTMTNAARFMLGETNEKSGITLFELGLDAQLDMYGRDIIFFHDTDLDFYKLMKKNYRKNFDQLYPDLLTSFLEAYLQDSRQSIFLPYIHEDEKQRRMLEDALFSIIDQTYKIATYKREEYAEEKDFNTFVNSRVQQLDNELIREACSYIVAYYVAMDTVHTYRLYQMQLDVINRAEIGNVHIPMNHRFAKERVIPIWPDIKEHIAWEQRISRESARQAIQGVNVDRAYIQKIKQTWIDDFPAVSRALSELPDPSDPYPHFRKKAMMIYWYSRVIDLFNGHYLKSGKDASDVTYSNPENWVNWEFTGKYNDPAYVGADELRRILDFSAVKSNDEEYDYWVENWVQMLLSIRPHMSRSDIFKGGIYHKFQITKEKPQFDFQKWVYDECFQEVEFGWKLAQWKAEWLAYDFSLTEKKHYSPEQLPKNKRFQRYFTFLKAGISIPTHDQIKYGTNLVTPAHKKYIRSLQQLLRDLKNIAEGRDEKREFTKAEAEALLSHQWRNKQTDDGGMLFQAALDQTKNLKDVEPDYQNIALSHDWLSVTKKGMKFYLPSEEDENDQPNPEHFNHPLRKLYDAIELLTLIADADKYLLHSERDSKIHSIMARVTRTGRFSSNNPNMQNDKREAVKGWIIPPDDSFVIVGLDLSNAENVSGAMISGDSAFAMSTEHGDYHFNRAQVYFKEEMQHYLDTGQTDKAMKLRKKGKPITFGEAYGQGDEGIAIATRVSIEEVKQIRQNLENAFPILYEAKKARARASESIQTYPAYTSLWTGARVIVPLGYRYRRGKRELTVQGYRNWNYLQQGAVGEIIARAMVLVQEWLEDNGYETYVLFNVHDELVLCLKITEVDLVIPKICEIMGEIVPQEYRERTIPATHFVADLGPENAFKWGFQEGKEYPLGHDYFWNRYGKFKLPQEELDKAPKDRKTPTWRGPVHEGWTLEQEMKEQRQRQIKSYLTEDEEIVLKLTDNIEAWIAFKEIYKLLYKKAEVLGIEISGTLLNPRDITLSYGTADRTFHSLLFEEWVNVAYKAYHRGHSNLYRQAVQAIVKTFSYCQMDAELTTMAIDWLGQYGSLLEEVANKEPVR